MNLAYLFPRLVRHFLPLSVTQFLLRRGWIIKPGLETRSPQEAARRYQSVLETEDIVLRGKRVLVFGYGGSFALGCALLDLGAGHVVLIEKDVLPDARANAALLPLYPVYLQDGPHGILPNPQVMTLVQADVRKVVTAQTGGAVDIVLSTSVYEHLGDVAGITRALAALTVHGGAQLHYIDLRDHFFRYPFEMLCYSERVWRGWLNPTSHHNRFRFKDYRAVFEKNFDEVQIEVLERDEAAFERAKARIRPEFLTGDKSVDAITLIKVLACRPRAAAAETHP